MSDAPAPDSVPPLPASRLHTPCNPDHLPFANSDELPDLDEDFAHTRAVEALRFGLDIRQPNYNLFVLGDPDSGLHAIATAYMPAARLESAGSRKKRPRATKRKAIMASPGTPARKRGQRSRLA